MMVQGKYKRQGSFCDIFYWANCVVFWKNFIILTLILLLCYFSAEALSVL